MSKKVLIITYYWPPAGGPGVQRWLKFVKYLPQYNITPIVYTALNANYPIIDKQFINEISNDVLILKQPIKEPYKWSGLFLRKQTKSISKGIISKENQTLIEKFLLFIRGNFFIPDARVLWVKPSVKYLSEIIKKHNIDTVITTGPPHSVHLIGYELKLNNNLRWITDFRDPWTTISYHKDLKLLKKSQQKHLSLEHKVLNFSDEIIVTSASTKKEFEKKTSKKITVITNGYDVEKYEKKEIDKEFSITHIGSLLSDRNPQNLWKILGEIIAENKSFKELFKLKFVGINSKNVLDEVFKHIPAENVKVINYVSHNDALEYQKKSAVLLLIESNTNEKQVIIPAKLFEYMVSGRPILSFGHKLADFSSIVKETNTGSFFTYYDEEILKNQILNYFQDFLNNKLITYPVNLQQYSRKNLTKKLAEIILKS